MTPDTSAQPDEPKALRKRFKEFPQEKTMMQPPPKFFVRTEGFVTIDMPPVKVPTPLTAARWLATNPTVRTLFILVVGIGIGTFWQSGTLMPTIRPTPVVTVTETLENFVAREAAALSADERGKLITVTRSILTGHFDTPSAIREEFRYQRLKAGINSPAFETFSTNWSAKVTKMKIEESVESMQEIYTALLDGLQMVKSYIDFTVEPHPGEPVEGFLTVSPSNVTSDATSEDVPVSPDFLERQRIFRRR